MPDRKAPSRIQIFRMAVILWIALETFMVSLCLFAWRHGPPNLFRHWATTTFLPLFVACFICVPLTTLLPLYTKACEEKESQRILNA